MKFAIDRTAALRAMTLVSGAVARRGAIPILTMVKIEATDGLSITATDLDIQITGRAQAHVERPGTCTMEGERFRALLQSLPEGGELTVDVDENRATVICGRSRFRFPTLPVQDFPDIDRGPAADAHRQGQSIQIETSDLAKMIEKVASSMDNGDTMTILSGIYLHSSDGKFRCVAAHSKSLALAQSGMALDMEKGCVIPGSAVPIIAKLAGSCHGSAALGLSGSRVSIDFADCSIISKVVDGEYPMYDRLIPKDKGVVALVDAGLFEASAHRVLIMSDERVPCVRCIFTRGQLRIEAGGQNLSEGADEIDIDYNGDDITLPFNGRCLVDILSKIKTENVHFRLGSKGQPTLIRETGEARETYLLMAMLG